MTTQQTDALQCAADLEYSIARHGMQDSFTLNAYRAMKMVRTQHARIADLEAQLEAIGAGGVSGPLIGQPQAMPDLSQLTERGAKAWAGVDAQGLREGFTAADMATASAQGFRDGVASVSARWQSIETAPKDGTRILVHPAIEVADAWSKAHWSAQNECWIVGGSPSGVLHTAWHPLPPPPTSAAGVEHGPQ